MPNYSVYGLTLRVPFEIQGAPVAVDGAPVDVDVVEGDVPFAVENPAAQGEGWQIADGVYLRRGGTRVGRFLVDGPATITYQRSEAAEDQIAAFLLMHDVMGAVLRYRGDLVLHANAVTLSRGSVIVSGESGAGKSTTTAGLLKRGGRLITDDLSALRLETDGVVRVQPGLAELHLTSDSVAALNLDISAIEPFSWRAKTAMPHHGTAVTDAQPVTDIYLLTIVDDEELEFEQLVGSAAFEAMVESIYGPMLPAEHEGIFSLLSRVCLSLRVWSVRRPRGVWCHDELVERIVSG